MGHSWALFLSLCLAGSSPAAAQPIRFLPQLNALQFQTLLQRFVKEQHLKSFRDLGVEEDFDHAHLLFDSREPERPVAILYHTQELGGHPGMDPKARNWLQWVGRGTVEDASLYERKVYPRSAAWEWFLQRELKLLRQRHTILDKMLDPARLGIESPRSLQWVFSRADCGGAPPADDASRIRVTLPAGPVVCLDLSQT
ncbi:MAG: hypothetical protein HY926_16120 [Elusimicrobia bacterium]|nr:hypothetical protein [Elusimicrobiota bacterium]